MPRQGGRIRDRNRDGGEAMATVEGVASLTTCADRWTTTRKGKYLYCTEVRQAEVSVEIEKNDNQVMAIMRQKVYSYL